jgi:hypothetical protein
MTPSLITYWRNTMPHATYAEAQHAYCSSKGERTAMTMTYNSKSARILKDGIARMKARQEAQRITCNECDLVSINGLPCHEHGCPNVNARWDAADGEWIKQYECRECGFTVDRNVGCDCQEPLDTDTDY